MLLRRGMVTYQLQKPPGDARFYWVSTTGVGKEKLASVPDYASDKAEVPAPNLPKEADPKMTKQIMDFHCPECRVIWREWWNASESFNCPECGARIYSPRSFEIVEDGRAILCLICGRKSWNQNDIDHKYCGHCHIFHKENDES